MAKVRLVPIRSTKKEADLGWFCQLDFLESVSDWLEDHGVVVGIGDIDDVVEALQALGYVKVDVEIPTNEV
jgi:hypothetical protein